MSEKINIVIVEDSLTQAEELRYILESNNFRVIHAIDAGKAIEILETDIPDVIISDIVMPGMNGYELCRQIKEKELFSHIPFILLTSLTDPTDIIKGLECGADSFITKPYNEEFLLSKINYLYLNYKLRKDQTAEMGLEVLFAGKRHIITSGRMQILDLLFSTYENSVLQNKELIRINKDLLESKQELNRINKSLEKSIEERTLELQKNQDLLVTLTSEAPIVMFSIDNDGIFTFSDGKGLSKIGLVPGQVVGLSAFDVYKDYPDIKNAVSTALSGKEVRNLSDINGYFFDALYQPVFDEARNITGLVGIAVDVTQQKLSEARLAESEDKFRNVFENSMLGKSITGLDGSLKVNKSFGRITGYSEKELLKMRWEDITYPDDIEKSKRLVQAMTKGEIQNAHFEKRYVHKNGKIIFTDVQTTLQRDENGVPQYFISSIMDITDRKEAELTLQVKTRQLEISNKEKETLIATKDKLFSIIAHDLIGNFNPLLGFSELLIEEFDTLPPEEVKSINNTLHNSIKKQFQLLNNLLEWGRLQKDNSEFNPENINLLSSINESIGFLNQNIVNKNIQTEVKIDPVTEVLTEKHMLDTILRNLISNAIKYSHKGGKIKISAFNENGKIKIIVADEGVGIKKQDLENLLQSDKFLTTPGTANEKGSGLGLILCREFIEKQGGKFELKSIFGKGTSVEFTLQLPAEKTGKSHSTKN